MKLFYKIFGLILISVELINSQPTALPTNCDPDFELSFDKIKYLNIPERSKNAMEGSDIVNIIMDQRIEEREKRIVREILSGNVPSFSRKLKPINTTEKINGELYRITFFAICDYLTVGSDSNYLYLPMTPSTAQHIADTLNCFLPTKKLVDIIYNHAEIKLNPQPIPPSDKITTVPIFKQHTDSIKNQIIAKGFDRMDDKIIAGHKKDIIISKKIYSDDRNYDRVVIYGWHISDNNPIQPVYNGHTSEYADYSHGIRLVDKHIIINGILYQIKQILNDPALSSLISEEFEIEKPYYQY